MSGQAGQADLERGYRRLLAWVTAGPYRLLRHPGYAGGLLAMLGFGVLYGNWVSFAVITVLWLVIILWRIRIEERTLLAALGDKYRGYAAHRKRLIPLIW